MKIALLGGTGNLGMGLSLRLAILGYEVIVGSRSEERAKRRAEEYKVILSEKGFSGKIRGLTNSEASKLCEIAIITVPWEQAFMLVENLKIELNKKITISPIVPMKKDGIFFRYVEIPEGSAGEKIARILKDSRVVSAYHNVPADRFADLDSKFDWDVPICGDDDEAKKVVIEMTNEVKGLRGLDCGDLRNSKMVESLTVLILNLMAKNKLKEIGVKFC
ncbi:MAG: NADPH-dependent F420 reductase [Archaeoglobaceae archaeon]|nr:NADPH-dependent F420 reductase [Archaeoglobaceae archaeon]MDW7989211.1 NADPH-dependent F420 reductase [Archaeoglobaceae archaeon]